MIFMRGILFPKTHTVWSMSGEIFSVQIQNPEIDCSRDLNHDEDVYGKDAHMFCPERHLDDKGKLKPLPVGTKDEGHCTFGFGRR